MTFSTGPGERIIWRGQPAQGIRFTAGDIFVIPFSLIWTGAVIAIFLSLIFGKHRQGFDPGFIMLPLFLIVGVYFTVGRFFTDMMVRRRTHYYLTNQRAVIESGLFTTSSRSINLAAVPEIGLRQERQDRGTIEFGTSTGPFGMLPRGWPGSARYLPPSFEGVDNARHVYDMVLSAQRDAKGKP